VEAWRLSRRVKLAGSQSSGKFKSEKFSKTVFEMIIYIPAGLMLAYFVQLYVMEGVNVHLPQIFCGIVIFWQFWSVLENKSSCNGAKWAKVLQKVMIDKTERHYDVDLSILKEKEEGKEEEA
jgi:hypothetical protein